MIGDFASAEREVLIAEINRMRAWLIEIRHLLPITDEYSSVELPAAVRKYINELGCRAGDPEAAKAGEE